MALAYAKGQLITEIAIDCQQVSWSLNENIHFEEHQTLPLRRL